MCSKCFYSMSFRAFFGAFLSAFMLFGEPLQAAPLHEAAHSCDLQQLAQILDEGVDVDLRDSYGGTALHAAMFQDDTEIVRLLIDRGFDVNAVGPRNGYTPLHDAVWANNLPAAELLLQSGARTDIRALDGQTAEQKAINEDKNEMADLIRNSQSKVYDPRARDEMSPNDIAAFVYSWFANFDHQVPLEQILPHLGDPLEMAFPDFPIRSEADFTRWYQGVVDTIQWNSHDISNLEVSGDQGAGWSVSLDVHWLARTYEGTEYDMMIHQDWHVALADDGTLEILRLQANPIE